MQFFCFMLFNDNGVSTALIGTCPYGDSQRLPRNLSVSEFYEDSRLCSFYNRKGQLCGECGENYTLPASSYHLILYICIRPDINYQHILLLEYAIGIYPLFLILLTFILVKLHDNFALVVWLWKPFHRCLAVFWRQWNI